MRIEPSAFKGTIFDVECTLPLHKLVERGLTESEKNLWLVADRKIRKSKGLFINLDSTDRSSNFTSIYTLVDARPLHYKDYNGMVRYDLKQLYLACGDLTEVEFVSKFLYDASHWEKLCSNKLLMKNHISVWRQELKKNLESEMISVLLTDAVDVESKSKTTSAKYLLEKYLSTPTTTPSSTKRDSGPSEVVSRELQEFQDDLKRISKVHD